MEYDGLCDYVICFLDFLGWLVTLFDVEWCEKWTIFLLDSWIYLLLVWGKVWFPKQWNSEIVLGLWLRHYWQVYIEKSRAMLVAHCYPHLCGSIQNLLKIDRVWDPFTCWIQTSFSASSFLVIWFPEHTRASTWLGLFRFSRQDLHQAHGAIQDLSKTKGGRWMLGEWLSLEDCSIAEIDSC